MANNMLTITPSECAAILRKYGMKTTPRAIIDGIDTGFYPFGRIVAVGETGKRTVEIFRVNFCEWLHQMTPKPGVHDAVM